MGRMEKAGLFPQSLKAAIKLFLFFDTALPVRCRNGKWRTFLRDSFGKILFILYTALFQWKSQFQKKIFSMRLYQPN